MASMTTLITGACRSGKSRFALERLAPSPHPIFIATGERCDDEMSTRIARHIQDRDESGRAWTTIEEPLFLTRALQQQSPAHHPVLIDCLTLWVSNWLLAVESKTHSHADWDAERKAFLDALKANTRSLVLVTNEVGWGVVPDHPLGRTFRDWAGSLNQQVAALADEVVLMVCGIPWTIKRPEVEFAAR